MTSLVSPPLTTPSFLPTQLPPISNFTMLPHQQAPSSSFLPPILQQSALPPMRLSSFPENSAFHILAGLASSAIPQKPVEWTEEQIVARSKELLSTTSDSGNEFDLCRFSLVNTKGLPPSPNNLFWFATIEFGGASKARSKK